MMIGICFWGELGEFNTPLQFAPMGLSRWKLYPLRLIRANYWDHCRFMIMPI